MTKHIPLTSDRRQRVLEMAAAGATTGQMARAENCTLDQIKYILRELFEAYGVTAGRVELVALAYMAGDLVMPAGSTPKVAEPAGRTP